MAQKFLYTFVAMGIFAGNLIAQTVNVDDAIAIALTHSPDINISKSDLEAAKARESFQTGDYLPQINASVIAGKSNLKVGDYNLDGSGLMGKISASQLIYDFGKTGGKMDASKQERLSYEANLKQTIAQKILEVKTNYYNVLKAKSIIDVNKKDVELQKEQLRRSKRYFETGIKTIIDVTDAQVRLTQAKLNLNNSTYDLKLQKAIFEQSLGYLPEDGTYDFKYQTTDWLQEDFKDALPKVSSDVASYIKFAYEHRHELAQARFLSKSASAKVRSYQGEYLPSLYLAGDYAKFSTDENDPLLHQGSQWQAGAVLNWNLYAGNKTNASVAAAKQEKLKTESQIAKLKLQIKREVVQAYLGVKRTNDAIILSESVARASLQKFNQAQKRYEHGLSDYIELQDARQGYIQSLNNLVRAYYDYFIALAQLDYATGK